MWQNGDLQQQRHFLEYVGALVFLLILFRITAPGRGHKKHLSLHRHLNNVDEREIQHARPIETSNPRPGVPMVQLVLFAFSVETELMCERDSCMKR